MRAFDRRRRALASALILLCLTLPALAQSTLTGPLSKPYTLRIHYATAAEPGTDTAASNKPKARRIELTVAAIDAGTVTTRDATLDYRFEASPDSAQITLVLELTYAVAGGQHTVRAQMLVPRRQWQRIGESPAGSDNLATFVRIDPS